MAFSVKTEPQENNICPICRRSYDKGRRIQLTAYCSRYDTMCESCYKHGYLNIRNGRTAAMLDDTANPLTRLRPAQVLEKPLIAGREIKSERGFEVRMPHITADRIIYELILWLAVCACLRFALWSTEGFGSADISAAMLELTVFAGSCIFGVKNLCLLVKGIFCGMGHIRRLLLLLTLPLLALPAWFSFPHRLIDAVTGLIHFCS